MPINERFAHSDRHLLLTFPCIRYRLLPFSSHVPVIVYECRSPYKDGFKFWQSESRLCPRVVLEKVVSYSHLYGFCLRDIIFDSNDYSVSNFNSFL